MNQRTGATSRHRIPTNILDQLNRGSIPTATLVEWLEIDQSALLQKLLADAERSDYFKPILQKITQLKKPSANSLCKTIGAELLTQTHQHHDPDFLKLIAHHQADMVRCWAAYALASRTLDITTKLEAMQNFAADPHFAVREIAWLSVRADITQNLAASIAILASWTSNHDENIRRFASEATRPRGVWCTHIQTLKQNPSLALPILEPLKADPAKYVQNSVGNWLNDAGKTCPDFVQTLCQRWQEASPNPATSAIIKRALRNLK